MATVRNSAQVGTRGRIVVPRAICEHLGLRTGDYVLFRTLATDEVVMESRDQVKARILRGASALPMEPIDIDTTTGKES